MKKLFAHLCGICLLVFATTSFANNITVSNVSLEGQVVADHYCLVQFDLSWDNSWRTTSIPQNWDAAWVFIKYSVSGGPWLHAKIDPAGSVQPAGCTLDFADSTGVIIYRDADGSGTFSVSDIGIRWSYGDQGVNDDATVELKVFAIEMVYVPEGSFYLGDGGSYGHFFEYPTSANSYLVDGSSITCGQSANNLWVTANDGTGMNGYTIPSDFPIGYDAFYCMKYEISQEQYLDFLNCLTRLQQDKRTKSDVSQDEVNSLHKFVMTQTGLVYGRNGIASPLTGLGTTDPITFYCDYNDNDLENEADDGQNIACNNIHWMDVAAYADWTGLRPMTEGEYEKASRGPNFPTQYEFVNGGTTYNSIWYILSNDGAENEGVTNMTENTGNFLLDGISTNVDGPVRCGIFASSSTNHTRIETGATYYGIMEMSGNLREMVVGMFYLSGFSYTGLHGDGTLDTDGNANTDYWPGINNNSQFDVANGVYSTDGVINNAGAVYRGGSWLDSYTLMRLSNRTEADEYNPSAGRMNFNGGRLVRTSPTP